MEPKTTPNKYIKLKEIVIDTLEDLGQYRPIDETLIDEMIYHKQLCDELKEEYKVTESLDDRGKVDNLYTRHDRNFRQIIDSLNLSPYYRSKLNTVEEEQIDDPFQELKGLLS